jgi:hypothetical protein
MDRSRRHLPGSRRISWLAAVTAMAVILGVEVAAPVEAAGQEVSQPTVPASLQLAGEYYLAPLYAGDLVPVSGSCSEPGDHLVTSPGFVAPIPLNSKGRVVGTSGDYEATLRCGAVARTVAFLVRPVGYAQVNLDPSEVDPGGRLMYFDPGGTVHQGSVLPYACFGPADPTSPGFAGPIVRAEGGINSWWRGYVQVVQTPGTYTATETCLDGRTATFVFRVRGTASPPSGTAPQVPVKPKGAPQTGGGGTASNVSQWTTPATVGADPIVSRPRW